MTKLYAAIGQGMAETFMKYEAKRLLTSFAYKKAAEEVVEAHRRRGKASSLLSLKLDSGAYTAWTKGKQVDIEAYARWVLEITAALPGIDVSAINLDVIPGTFGTTSTTKEREASMARSMENADFLRAAGIDVIEVFHQDEPFEYLATLRERLPAGAVLAISPRNDLRKPAKMEWMDRAYSRLIDDWPRVPRTHILGSTTGPMIQRYPAYSADSSQWAYFNIYGIRVHPRYRTHKFPRDDRERRAMRTKEGREDNVAHTVDVLWTEEQSLAKSWARRGLEFT